MHDGWMDPVSRIYGCHAKLAYAQAHTNVFFACHLVMAAFVPERGVITFVQLQQLCEEVARHHEGPLAAEIRRVEERLGHSLHRFQAILIYTLHILRRDVRAQLPCSGGKPTIYLVVADVCRTIHTRPAVVVTIEPTRELVHNQVR